MARYTDATDSWQNVTLTKDEIWYCHEGLLIVSTDASPAPDAGIGRTSGQSIGPYPAGKTIHYRAGITGMVTAYERQEVSL
jgi:hypothetical protein